MHLGTDAAPQSGLDLLREIRGRGNPVGLILITGRANSDTFIDAIRSGVDDLLLKPVSLAALRESVSRTFARLDEKRAQLSQLHHFAEDLLQLRTRLADSNQNFNRVERTVVEAMLEALEVREPGSYMHSLRVQAYTIYFAHAVGYPESLLPQLERAAILHDIGKIGLSDLQIFKPDAMSSTEHERTHQHTIFGEQILSRIPFLRPSALIVRQHHERFDGAGYPDGLSGEQIPLGARIFSIVDTLDAITTGRPYRPALSLQHALNEILRGAGSQFDPRLTEIFARIPLATWHDLRTRVEQRRLTHNSGQPGAVPELAHRNH
jgi:putative nucleotidyltransferase with HDIG domain